MLYVNPILNRPSSTADSGAFAEIKKKVALEELEHLFTYMLLQEMRKTVPEDPILGNSRARQTYEEMLDDALSGEMAKSGQLGIVKQISDQLNAAEQSNSLKSAKQNMNQTGIPLEVTDMQHFMKLEPLLSIGQPNYFKLDNLKPASISLNNIAKPHHIKL